MLAGEPSVHLGGGLQQAAAALAGDRSSPPDDRVAEVAHDHDHRPVLVLPGIHDGVSGAGREAVEDTGSPEPHLPAGVTGDQAGEVRSGRCRLDHHSGAVVEYCPVESGAGTTVVAVERRARDDPVQQSGGGAHHCSMGASAA